MIILLYSLQYEFLIQKIFQVILICVKCNNSNYHGELLE